VTICTTAANAYYSQYMSLPAGYTMYLFTGGNLNFMRTNISVDPRTKMPFASAYSQTAAQIIDRRTHMPVLSAIDDPSGAITISKVQKMPTGANTSSSFVFSSIASGQAPANAAALAALLLAAATDVENAMLTIDPRTKLPE
jgi:hypothetical protein